MRFSYFSRYTQYISRYTNMGKLSRGSGFQTSAARFGDRDSKSIPGIIVLPSEAAAGLTRKPEHWQPPHA